MLNVSKIPTLEFQSTLPQGERPKDKIGKFAFNKISIHAPTRGATSASKSEDSRARNFNPRSHKGSDRCQLINSFEYDEFQSTLPQGERQQFYTKFHICFISFLPILSPYHISTHSPLPTFNHFLYIFLVRIAQGFPVCFHFAPKQYLAFYNVCSTDLL